MRASDQTYVAPDMEELNAKVLADLPQDRLSAVFQNFWNLAVPEIKAPLTPKTRTYYRDPAPLKTPLSAKNKAKIRELNTVAWFRAANSDHAISLAEDVAPRAPGIAPPLPRPVVDTEETRLLRSIDETRNVIAQLEKAAAEARVRLAEMELKL